MRFQFNNAKKHMEKEISKCEKLENSLKVLFGGYYKREQALREKLSNLVREYQTKSIELDVFKVFES